MITIIPKNKKKVWRCPRSGRIYTKLPKGSFLTNGLHITDLESVWVEDQNKKSLVPSDVKRIEKSSEGIDEVNSYKSKGEVKEVPKKKKEKKYNKKHNLVK